MTSKFKQVTNDAAIVVTAGAYTAKDVVGGLITCTLPEPLSSAGVWLTSIGIDVEGSVLPAFNVHVLNQTPASALADNAPFVLSAADHLLKKAHFELTAGDYKATQDDARAKGYKSGLNIALQCPEGIILLYLECTGAPTLASTGALAQVELGLLYQE
jgi:hypothetical protein